MQCVLCVTGDGYRLYGSFWRGGRQQIFCKAGQGSGFGIEYCEAW